MYSKYLSQVLCLLLLLLAWYAQALDKAPSIFYPLPTQAQGKVFVAQNLFLGDEGGIWIHDVHGKVVFFDGQNILPRRGSVLAQDSGHIAYFDNAFWSYVENEVYRTYPAQHRELVFSLTAGSVIKNIGASNGFIWLTDDAHFYTYNIQTKRIDTYPLSDMYQFNQVSQLTINDAKFLLSKWVLATNAGVYLSDGESFSHVLSSKKHFIEKLYFSSKNRELIVGTLNGALIIDIKNPNSQHPKRIGYSHVLSLAETDNEYWVGTEDGLFVYSFLTNNVVKLESNDQDSNGLPGNQIYSLVNDLQGGIWIATDKGIRYFSLFGFRFERNQQPQLIHNQIKKIIPRLDKKGYWVLTNQGLYQFDSNWNKIKLLFNLPINDFVQLSNTSLWFATHEGLVVYNLETEAEESSHLPFNLRTAGILHLTLDNNGLLWGANENQLWSYDVGANTLTNYGIDWFVDAFLPAKVTLLKATQRGLFIGTDHGVYTLNQGKIVFRRPTSGYGRSVNILEGSNGDIWFASSYGLFNLSHDRNEFNSIPLAEDNISPKCLAESQEGIWLTSSNGISLYNRQGDIKKHYAAPHGLIHNEFQSGVCTSSIIDNKAWLLSGSRFGLLRVSPGKLVTATPPNTSIIFSQISIDHTPVMIGRSRFNPLELKYGSSISFLFGSLPESRTQSLEFRIEGDGQWQPLEGSQLTLDHLLPGDYRILVRDHTQYPQNSTMNSLSFVVAKPWYLSSWAILFYSIIVLGCVAVASLWRSHWVAKANRELKSQVALKTEQLRHQSKIVLTNNHQLRKQLQIRHVFVEQMLDSISPTLDQLIYRTQLNQLGRLERLAQKVKRELTLLRNVRSDKASTQQIYDLSIILNSSIDSWRDEFDKAEITLVVNNELQQSYIESESFNFDLIFNMLLSDAVNRLYRNQSLQIHCYERERRLFVVIIDSGDQMMNSSVDGSTSGFEQEELHQLMRSSGGEIHIFSSSERNLTELSWPSVDLLTEESEAIELEDAAEKVTIDPLEKEWLKKVELLIQQYYSDPEFSTSSAAKLLFVSERSLQRRFKAVTGKTFKEYLNEVRLEKACQRLLAGEKISQVAFDSGFNDPSYFSQRFKHHFGLSPTQFIDDNE
ncbi:helix-turn-helix domain-containing protein [Vibrio aestuarianus]|uniref:helix-turn-helix domain-containing protein n=1 Tax=Vibrio aestuarianus TaxID=28171 RepID=UPI00237CA544|nr:AraC family transcriptional regulator [Vibrio aestuarianus]MDE1334452.1 helix-turn-helix domain-containing protein [Vibrio aestuarianus]